MTGEFVAEGSLLCSTVYWNISSDRLPEIKEPGEPVGTLLQEVASDLGLHRNTLVSIGALDQVAGAIGVGNIRPGIFWKTQEPASPHAHP